MELMRNIKRNQLLPVDQGKTRDEFYPIFVKANKVDGLVRRRLPKYRAVGLAIYRVEGHTIELAQVRHLSD